MRIVAALLVLTLPLAACGNEVAREAADEQTAGISITVSTVGGPGVVTGEGVFDLVEGDEGQLTLSQPAEGGGTVETELRVVDDVAYVSEPSAPGAGADRRWLRVSEDDLVGQSGGAPTEALASANPVRMVRLLDRATDFEEDGTADMSGEEMTRYRGTIDIAEVAEDEDRSTGAQLRKAGLDEIPGEVLVDDETRLRRLTFTIDLGKALQAEGGAPGQRPIVTFVVELDDFGTEIDVQAPPSARQVKPDGQPVDGPATSQA